MFQFICGIIGFIIFIFIVLAILNTSKNTKKMVEAQSSQSSSRSSDRYCPECGRAIPFDAEICPYCGKQFLSLKEEKKKPETDEKKKEKDDVNDRSQKLTKCPFCGTENKPGSKFCKKCGKELSE